MKKPVFAFFALLSCIPSFAQATPTIDIKAASATAEKGIPFQIQVEVKTEASLAELTVTANPPEGFRINVIPSVGIETEPGERDDKRGMRTARLKNIGPRSSMILTYRVDPPDLLGRSSAEDGDSGDGGWLSSLFGKTPYSTREAKTFSFNAFYPTTQQDKSVVTSVQSKSISMKYTTSIGIYLGCGLLGVVLGFIIKIVTQYKNELVEEAKSETTARARARVYAKKIFVGRFPLLATLLLIGFGALLALSRDGLPITSWHQAILLGMTLGVLSDDQLLTKIKA